MSALHFALTPKMKPLPGNRSVLVAALDVGTSKIAMRKRSARVDRVIGRGDRTPLS